MRYDAGETNRFDLTRYPDYRGDFPPDVYQLHRFGHLEEYEAEWGRRWDANGIGALVRTRDSSNRSDGSGI
jgi:hypothetical protein